MPGPRAATAPERAAFALLLAGALLVLVTSAAYVLAGPVAALPGGAADAAQARAATAAAAGWMKLACVAGVPGDLLLVLAGALLARQAGQPPAATAGWLLLAVSGAVFTVVDTMVGQVLPPLALGGDALLGAYAGARSLFDALFHLGTLAGGMAALALGLAAPGARGGRWSLSGAGLVGVAAGGAGLLGAGVPMLTGAAVVLVVLAFASRAGAGLKDLNRSAAPAAAR